MKNHAVVLLELIKKHGFHTMIEIGVCRGDCAKIILEGTQKPYDFEYYGIDPYISYLEYDHTVDVNAHPIVINQNKVKAEWNLSSFNNVCIFQMFSCDAIHKFMKDVVDLVFVDGNHAYKYVKQDLNLYWSKIKDFGIMAAHDYGHPKFPGVKIAVDEFVEENSLELLNEGDVWYFYKNK